MVMNPIGSVRKDHYKNKSKKWRDDEIRLSLLFLREINLTLRRLSPNCPSILPRMAAHKLAPWLSTWHSSFVNFGNQVVQVVSSSTSLAALLVPMKISTVRLPRRLAGRSELRHGASLGLSVVRRHRELQAWLPTGEDGKGNHPKTGLLVGMLEKKHPKTWLLLLFFGFSLYGKVERV